MADTMSDFLDFGDDHNDQFADEYANLNRCGGSPSSEDAELNAMDNSVSALSAASQNEVDLEMSDFALGASFASSSWTGVSDSFSQMHVKADPVETDQSRIFEAAPATIPGSWPTSASGLAMKTAALRNPVPSVQGAGVHLQPSSFTLAQIAPPSLPQERSNSTTASSLCSESIKEEEEARCHESDLLEPAKKRRASETVRKTFVPTKAAGHKRTTSIAATDPKVETPSPAVAPPVGVELDESGDPIVAKRQDRLMRNRAAALASRERKREHVTRLETSVVDLENEKNRLKSQTAKMGNEITRLRKLLTANGIEDRDQLTFDQEDRIEEASTIQPDDAAAPILEEGPQKPDHPITSKARAAPTGFSPRGALKKSEILANQIRAEEHLRNVTMKQAGLLPANQATSSNAGAVKINSHPPTPVVVVPSDAIDTKPAVTERFTTGTTKTTTPSPTNETANTERSESGSASSPLFATSDTSTISQTTPNHAPSTRPFPGTLQAIEQSPSSSTASSYGAGHIVSDDTRMTSPAQVIDMRRLQRSGVEV